MVKRIRVEGSDAKGYRGRNLQEKRGRTIGNLHYINKGRSVTKDNICTSGRKDIYGWYKER